MLDNDSAAMGDLKQELLKSMPQNVVDEVICFGYCPMSMPWIQKGFSVYAISRDCYNLAQSWRILKEGISIYCMA